MPTQKAPVDLLSRGLTHAVAVGRVGPRSARLWLRTPQPGVPHVLQLWAQDVPGARAEAALPVPQDAPDGTHAFDVPGSLAGLPGLEPLRRYRFRVMTASGEEVGEGAFRTSPEGAHDAPRELCFGFLSCNQPFHKDGRLRPQSAQMLAGLHEALEAREARFLLLTGDQVYSDYPPRFSLFSREHFARVAPPGRSTLLDCSAEEVRALYHTRYRAFWALPEWRALQAHFPSYPMLDDHEVVDNFGSDVEHGRDRWRSVREGALAAYHDYQGSRLDAARGAGGAHYGVDYGDVGVFVADLRSQRRVDEGEDGPQGQVLSPVQLAELEGWLRAHREAAVVGLVLSVPIAFMPSWVARLLGALGRSNDAVDRWSHPLFKRDRDALLGLLHAHQQHTPRQRLVLLSGDVHVGYGCEIRWKGEPARVAYQFTSSAVTHFQGPVASRLFPLLPRSQAQLQVGEPPYPEVNLLRGRGGRGKNPYGGVNAGVVHVGRGEDGRARLALELLGQRRGKVVPVFHSAWL